MCASSNVVCINVSCSMFKCRKKINTNYTTYWNLEHNSIEMKNLASFVRNMHLSFETVTN